MNKLFSLEIFTLDMECVHESMCSHVETLIARAHRTKNRIFTIFDPEGEIWYESITQ